MSLLSHLVAVLALAVLCAAWVPFQRWLKRVDPDARGIEDAAGCGGNCRRDRTALPAGREVQLEGSRDPGPGARGGRGSDR